MVYCLTAVGLFMCCFNGLALRSFVSMVSACFVYIDFGWGSIRPFPNRRLHIYWWFVLLVVPFKLLVC